LYKSKELDKDRPASIEADFEEVAASCGHFSFSLQDFASEMQTYLHILEELKEETERTRNRSWKWILFWQRNESKERSNSANDPEEETLIERNVLNQPDMLPSKDPPELLMERRGSVWNALNRGGNGHKAFYQKLLDVVRVLERDDGWSPTLNWPPPE
jgi:hypothetical protein